MIAIASLVSEGDDFTGCGADGGVDRFGYAYVPAYLILVWVEG